MATISLCMIVYNEENNLERCLKSARGFVDEIIAIDTGSTDRTKSICEAYGARIFDCRWTGDFSEARNRSISKATCDWILLLDADEELEIHNPDGLKQYLSGIPYDQISVRMTHFYGEKPTDEKRAFLSGAPRLIRNNGAVRFTGKIHEKMTTGDPANTHIAEMRRFLRILHFGYMNDAVESKAHRNLPMLLGERDKQPDDPWICHFLAVEYYRAGRFAEAFYEINAAIALFLVKKCKPPALAYKLKYDMLVTLGYHHLAYNGIEKAIELYPDYVDLHFYKGLLQYTHEEYEKAKSTFLCCLVLGETNMDYLILSGSGSFLAMYYLGLCHKKQREFEYAAEAIRQAQSLCPNLRSIRGRFENPDKTTWASEPVFSGGIKQPLL